MLTALDVIWRAMSGRSSVESADRKLRTWTRNQLIVVTSHFHALTGIGNILARHFGAFVNLRQPGWEVVKQQPQPPPRVRRPACERSLRSDALLRAFVAVFRAWRGFFPDAAAFLSCAYPGDLPGIARRW